MLTDAERHRFAAAFQRLSVMTYAARFGNVAPDAFRPPKAGMPDANGHVQLKTAIKREGQADASLEYLPQQDGDDWKIINIVAERFVDALYDFYFVPEHLYADGKYRSTQVKEAFRSSQAMRHAVSVARTEARVT